MRDCIFNHENSYRSLIETLKLYHLCFREIGITLASLLSRVYRYGEILYVADFQRRKSVSSSECKLKSRFQFVCRAALRPPLRAAGPLAGQKLSCRNSLSVPFTRKIPAPRDAAFAICGKHMADIVRAPGTSFRDSRGAIAALMTPAARWEFSFRQAGPWAALLSDHRAR